MLKIVNLKCRRLLYLGKEKKKKPTYNVGPELAYGNLDFLPWCLTLYRCYQTKWHWRKSAQPTWLHWKRTIGSLHLVPPDFAHQTFSLWQICFVYFCCKKISYEYDYMLCTVSRWSKSLKWEWGMIWKTIDKDGNSNPKEET